MFEIERLMEEFLGVGIITLGKNPDVALVVLERKNDGSYFVSIGYSTFGHYQE